MTDYDDNQIMQLSITEVCELNVADQDAVCSAREPLQFILNNAVVANCAGSSGI